MAGCETTSDESYLGGSRTELVVADDVDSGRWESQAQSELARVHIWRR
jgi:hypothetical protein